MERLISTELPSHIGEEVLIKGWLHTTRELGGLNFVIVRDRGGVTQVVVEDKAEMAKLKGLQTGSVLSISGKVAETKNTKLGVELTMPTIVVDQPITDTAPIDIAKESLNVELDTLLDSRVVALRFPKQQAIFKVQAGIKEGFRKALQERGFIEISSPKLLAEASEGGTNVFKVPYFGGTNVYLAQSPQFYKQMMVAVFERVFEIGPVFRAEKHNTSRHMSEYVSMDAEMGFIDSWTDVLEMLEYVVKYVVKYVWENYTVELGLLGATKPLIDVAAPRLKITEIHDIVFKETGQDYRNEPDLEPEEERFICEYAAKTWNSDLVFATHFPTKKRPFYTYPSDEDPAETYSADLLFRGVEITTAGRRITNYEQLVANATKWGVDLEKIKDYLDAFKYGMPAEGGFGMGLERLTAKITGLANVKEASLFPTDLKRAGGIKLRREHVAGGQNLRDAIVSLLTEREIKFELMKHAEVKTSEEAAEVRGTPLEAGVKALILIGKKSGKNYMLNLPANERADLKALQEIVGEPLEMEKPDEIMNKFGLELGAVPPFGNLMGMDVYMDKKVLDHAEIAFNCGLRTESIKMQSKDLVEVNEGKII